MSTYNSPLKKVAYLLSLNLTKYGGIIKKILTQAEYWQKQNITVEIFCLSPDYNGKEILENSSIPVNIYLEGDKINVLWEMSKSLINIKNIYADLHRDIETFNPDIIYFRNTYYQPYMPRLFSLFPTIAEINTNEWTEYRMLSKISNKYKFAYIYYLFTSKRIFSLIKGACLVTYEMQGSLKHYLKEIPFKTEVIPNSINIYKSSRRKSSHPNSTIPKLVFIGTPGMPWHGVDKIIELASKTTNELEFHIIGFDQKDFPIFSQNVIFYGVLPKDRYEEVIASCDIGLGTMALYRKQMNEACPLKVREYLSLGLPIIIGYEETAFIKEVEHPDCVLKLPNNAGKLSSNREDIISFSKKNKDRVLKKEEIEKYIDVSSLEFQRITFFQDVMNMHRK